MSDEIEKLKKELEETSALLRDVTRSATLIEGERNALIEVIKTLLHELRTRT